MESESALTPRPVHEDVTVFIPTLGREMLQGCLRAIATGNTWPEELIVLDQSPDARAAPWVNELIALGINAAHHSSSQSGVAAARNRGFERVHTRFVAVTDDDCLPASDWLERIVEHLRRDPDAVVTGRVEPGGTEVVVSIKTSRTPARYTRPSLRGDVLFPNNMGFAMSVFHRVGPFDERIRAAEDNDWCYRALRQGIPIVYSPEPTVTHLDWRDGPALEATYRAYARSQGEFFGKHLRHGDLHIGMRAVTALARALLRWLRGVWSGDADLVANGRAFLSQPLAGMVAGFRREK